MKQTQQQLLEVLKVNLLNKLNKKLIKTSAIALVLILFGCSKQESINESVTEEDITPSWIDVKDYSIETTVGNAVDLNGPTAYDAKDGMCEVQIKGYVNFNQPGEYYIVYEASDTSGNTQRVPITITVKEAIESTSQTTDNDQSSVQTGCDKANAKDSTKPCNYVLNSDIEKYDILYGQTNAKENCEKDIDELDVCEPIYTNDGSLWGYGQYIKEIED